MTVKIGADPEFEVMERNGNVVEAEYAMHSVGLHGLFKSKIGLDGARTVGEFRPSFGDSRTVNRSLGRLIRSLDKKYQGRYQIKGGSGTRWSIGGHIHFSGVFPNKDLLDKLDKFISLPLRDISDHALRSRSSYGDLGQYRNQPHGWEYRSPCSWVSHPMIARGVLSVAYLLGIAAEKGELRRFSDKHQLIEYAKEKNLYPSLAWYIEEYFNFIKDMAQKGEILEKIKVFAAWKKGIRGERRGRRQRRVREVSPQVAQRSVRFSFLTSDYSLDNIEREWVNRHGTSGRGDFCYQIVGARFNRTVLKVIFLPPSLYSEELAVRFERISSVKIRSWERSDIGLSRELRVENTQIIISVLEQLKEQLEQINV